MNIVKHGELDRRCAGHDEHDEHAATVEMNISGTASERLILLSYLLKQICNLSQTYLLTHQDEVKRVLFNFD